MSQSKIMKSKEQLRNQLQRDIYQMTSTIEFVEFLQKEKQNIQKFLASKIDMKQKRQHDDLSEKNQIRMNYMRYAEMFRFGQKLNNTDMIFRRANFFTQIMGIQLNTSAFLNTIQLLGKDHQAKYWRDQVMTAQAFGGYGQTQLGHGSNVQGIETTAHYDEGKKEFIINSPTVTSVKFWPGVLGISATHSVVQAKTFVKGKQIGLQTFVVPIRDQNLNVLPGIEAGDLGPKLGFERVDNGFLKINKVRIPLDYMLMKYIEVTPEGNVLGLEHKQNIKYAYGSMLYLRVHLVYGFALGYTFFPTIQLCQLYKQMGVLNEEAKRKQIIENTSLALGTILANTFTQSIYNNYITNLNARNFEKADKLLINCHILSATFKALASWRGVKTCIETMIKSKYLTFRTTMMPQNFNNSFPSVTYEGDNSVLLQQTGRFIIMKDSGEEIQKPNQITQDDNLQEIQKILKYVSAMEVRRLKKNFQKEFGSNVGMKTFWNQKYQRDIIEVSKFWGLMKSVQGIIVTLKNLTHNKEFFTKVGKIFVSKILEDAGKIYLYGFKIQPANVWKTVTEEQFWAVTNIRRPNDLPIEPHILNSRNYETMHAKL